MKRIIDVYYDVVNGVHRDSTGAQLAGDLYPYIIYKEKPLARVRLVTGPTMVAFTGITADQVLEVVIDNDYNHTTGVPCRTLAVGINVAGDWVGGGNADQTQGELSIRLDADTSVFSTKVGAYRELSDAQLEVTGVETGTGDLVLALRFPFRALNIMNDTGALPPVPLSAYYTKTESDARYRYVNFEWYTDGGGKKCLRILNDDGATLIDLSPP